MKLREIERLRGVAVFMVMAVHWDSLSHVLPEAARWSWNGVDLFFVISGFVVSRSLLKAMPPLEDAGGFVDALGRARRELVVFYARRFFRILPAALTVVLVQRLAVGAFPEQFGTPEQWEREAKAILGGIYNYSISFDTPARWFSPYWSLCVEEHFYLILPMIFIACRTTGRRLFACLVIALSSIAARALPPPATAVAWIYWRDASHLRFDGLMAGVAMALVAGGPPSTPVMPRGLMRWVVIPVVLVVFDCMPEGMNDYVAGHQALVAFAALSALLVFYASRDRGYVLEVPVLGRALEHLGARSYALYLVHQPVAGLELAVRPLFPRYAALVPRSPDDHPWRRAAILVAGALLVAEILHRTVERPFMRLGRRVVEGTDPPTLSRRARWALGGAGALFLVFAFRHPLMLTLGPRNLARGTAVAASSHESDAHAPSALTNGVLEDDTGLLTRDEDEPWALIDLGHPADLGAVRIYNRSDGWSSQTRPLEVSTSIDGERWATLGSCTTPFSQAWPCRLTADDLRARYVKLRIRGHASLGLSEVEIFEDPAMADVP